MSLMKTRLPLMSVSVWTLCERLSNSVRLDDVCKDGFDGIYKQKKIVKVANLFLNVVKRLQRVSISRTRNTTGLSAGRVIFEPGAHTFRTKVEGITERLVLAGESISAGHEHLADPSVNSCTSTRVSGPLLRIATSHAMGT